MKLSAKRPGFMVGAQYFLRGFSLIKTPGIRRFVVIPLAVNVVLFGGVLWFGVAYINAFVNQMKLSVSADSEAHIQWLNSLVGWISWILILTFPPKR